LEHGERGEATSERATSESIKVDGFHSQYQLILVMNEVHAFCILHDMQRNRCCAQLRHSNSSCHSGTELLDQLVNQ